MGKQVGVWIDHEKAFIVTLSGKEVSVKKIGSKVEPHYRLSGGYRGKSQSGTSSVSERTPEERHKHQLHSYYQELLKMLKINEEIFIFGPGEAKTELTKELNKAKEFEHKIAGVETSDKLTEKQIIAKVKNFYSGRDV
ncbi:MAG: hypothetical protein ABH862_06925 [Candidatus Omnitrophota bacterium]